MDFLLKFGESVRRWPQKEAFCIGKDVFSYQDFAASISAIRSILKNEAGRNGQNIVAVIAWDDLYSYAAAFAIWLEGKTFLPLSPRNPATRNNEIVRQTGAELVFSAGPVPRSMLSATHVKIVDVKVLKSSKIHIEPVERNPNDLMYVLFTSGSTGKPKGVQITYANFNAFVKAFLDIGYSFNENDRFLQIYDLTFDASLHCYIVPLTLGASVFTVPWNEVKYMYALRLLQNHELTFAKMPPSTIAFLRPYFPSIRLEKLRYCLFGGEPLDRDLVAEWRQCVPHAMIQNVYGPTEATVNCLQYEVPSDPEKIKHFNGIVAIGKPFGKNQAFVAGKNRNAANPFQKGELCIAGPQVSPGYWKDEEKTREVFFELPSGRKKERWYATGDIVLTDKDGDFLFCGRSDGQVQVQGFRVELGEIEYHTRTYLRAQAVALAKENYLGTQQIHLFVEKCADPVALREFLSRKLPDYMVPSEIISVEHFPLSVSGKIDRKKLYEMI